MDPYQVLGLTYSASDEEVKKAYRTLSRKYHPDANINNPNKDQAEAKFKEIQAAYSRIMDMREKGYSGSDYSGFERQQQQQDFGGFGNFGGFGGFGGFYGQQQQRTTNETQQDRHLRAAANYIQGGRYQEALNVLQGITPRTALWYFLSASASSGLGNNVVAKEYASEAVRLEPGNLQYQMLQQQLEGGGWYQTRQQSYGFPVMGGSNLCLRLCITSMICNVCLGGGMCCRCA